MTDPGLPNTAGSLLVWVIGWTLAAVLVRIGWDVGGIIALKILKWVGHLPT